MTDPLPTLERSLQTLRESAARLGKDMHRAAAALADGELPRLDLAAALREYRDQLRSQRAELGHAGGVCPPQATLDDLQSELQRLHRTRSAVGVIERTLRLRHVDDPAAPALERCRAAGREVVAQILASDDAGRQVAEEVLEGRHPAHALLRIVGEADRLSDDDWERDLEQVRAAYGKDLATAASRGKLRLPDDQAPPAHV